MRRYSAKEIAKATGLCVETVRRAWRKGELGVIRSPSGWFKTIAEPEVERWLATRSMGGGVMVTVRAPVTVVPPRYAVVIRDVDPNSQAAKDAETGPEAIPVPNPSPVPPNPTDPEPKPSR